MTGAFIEPQPFGNHLALLDDHVDVGLGSGDRIRRTVAHVQPPF